jgi:glycine betaine/proline transport system ATP-binding protein
MIRVEKIYKIFGSNSKAALELLEQGHNRDYIQEKTSNIVALADVSFNVSDGEIFVVMGLSGSGKSTLIRCINRLIEPDSGNIFIDDVDVLQLNKKELIQLRRKRIAMIFQSFAVLPFRTVFDNVKFGLEVQGVKKSIIREKVLHTLEMVGLERWKNAYPNELSGGMLQRVGTARALVNDPEILLMDEPFSALDPIIRCHMQDELLDLQEKVGKTIIFITHDLNEAIKVGNRCAILRNGRVVQIGTGTEILTQPVDGFVVDFSRDIDRCSVLRVDDVMMDFHTCTVDFTKEAPAAVLEKMRENKISSIFVTNGPEGKRTSLLGMMSWDTVQAAVSNDLKAFGRSVVEDIPEELVTRSGTSIKEICSVLNRNAGRPVVVANNSGNIIGSLTSRSLCRTVGDQTAVKE